ncbi:3'-5' exonuclease [Brevibacillus choshinensis]|uniref:3'-5' exonuclease n=1 Tax=Brevibacillus choshinensis TaxID=54911 RepID=UPI002E230FC9|nr:exonuclease domain-containing protein [Brevibacillus choshinensis]MED4751908.1 exonuclease domain-containing protein [Brevibacillus choshinensis]MED4784345.1 exonuclease domain-containing protein [Brevibacillus choshinensis]
MQIIVFDLETTLTHQKDKIPEIIEIGAAKVVTGKNGVEVDTFQRYTFPAIERRITERTRKFIGLDKENMPTFIPFRTAFASFLEWIGDDQDYYLSTWGMDDKRLMIEHCARFGLDFNWMRNYNDIQPPISMMLADRKQMSLKDAIDAAGIVQEGRLHSALVDAIHTAHLLIKFNKQVHLANNTPEENYNLSSSLYITCRSCKKSKYYTAFGRKSRRCEACLQYKKQLEQAVESAGVPQS